MHHANLRDKRMITRLRQALPLTAHARPSLLAALRRRTRSCDIALRLTVTGVFDLGSGRGVMCQFTVHPATTQDKLFVASIDQLAFDRRHPIYKEIEAWNSRWDEAKRRQIRARRTQI